MNQPATNFVMLNEWWARLAGQFAGPTDDGTMMTSADHPRPGNAEAAADRHLLWIDGVGTYLMCHGDRVTIGGPTQDGKPSDLSLLANLARKHATIVRDRQGYLIEASAPVSVSGRPVNEQTTLHDKYEIVLGERVRLRFDLPSVLSASARIALLSDHRPSPTVDGVVLMDDTCLLGPGNENHIRCPEWTDSVLLFRKDGQIWCKSRLELFVGEKHIPQGGLLRSGDVVTGPDLRFRIEAF